MSMEFRSARVARGTVLLLIAAASLLDPNTGGVIGMVVMAKSKFWKPFGESVLGMVLFFVLWPVFFPIWAVMLVVGAYDESRKAR